MAIRIEHGKARPQPPRAKDLPARLSARDRTRNHDAKGRFTAGNRAANGKGAKAAIRRHLGADATSPEVEALYRESRLLFTAFMRELPSDAPQIGELVARQARSAALSARYALRAAELGLDTDKGRKALEMSIKLDQRAERLAVTAHDLAERIARSAPPVDPHANLERIFAAERAARAALPATPDPEPES